MPTASLNTVANTKIKLKGNCKHLLQNWRKQYTTEEHKSTVFYQKFLKVTELLSFKNFLPQKENDNVGK